MKINIFDNIKTKKLETFFFILFCIGITVVSYFHEPRFDEFQAWGISKESIKDILFVIPHIECHPPLWFLLLKCFSFFNINPEIGVKVPTLLFMMGAVWLLIFKSPFPKIIKFTIPFTFYIFFQYSIINRPYSMFCFALFLIATLYKNRNEHPFIFISANILLCFSSLFGLTVVAGLILLWLSEIIQNVPLHKSIQDKRIQAFAIILIIGLLIFAGIFPDKSAIFNNPAYTTSNYLFGFLYATTGIFSEITFFDCIKIMYDIINNGGEIKEILSNINYLKFVLFCIFGLIINILLMIKFHNLKVLKIYLFPYILLSILYTHITTVHHSGLLLMFIIFVYWQGLENCKNYKQTKLSSIITYILIISLICTQFYWNIKIVHNEIKYTASPAREIANFLEKNNLTKYKIMGSWIQYNIYKNTETREYRTELPGRLYADNSNLYKKVNVEFISNIILPVVITQYFNKNIFYNLNPESPEKQYSQLKFLSDSENGKIKHLIKEQGLPDIIVGEVNLNSIFSEKEISNTNYILVKSIESKSIHKEKLSKYIINIYIKEEILKELELK